MAGARDGLKMTKRANAGPGPAFRFCGPGDGKGMLGMGRWGDRHVSDDQALQAKLKAAIARGDKDAVTALMRQGGISGILQTLRAVQAVAAEQSQQGSTIPALKVPSEVKTALQQGNLIDAVKRLREANPGISLKAAKDHVDALGARLPAKPLGPTASTFGITRERTPTVVMGDKPGGLRWLFVLIAFVALVWWWSTT